MPEPPPPELIQKGQRSHLFYADVNFLIPVVAAATGLILTLTCSVFCYKHRTYLLSLDGGVEL